MLCHFTVPQDSFNLGWITAVKYERFYTSLLLDAPRQSYSILWNCSHGSVCSCVHPSSFLKIGSLDFSDIVHINWPWYLVTDKVRFLKKKMAAQIWPKTRFFLRFGLLVFLAIACDDSLQQYITSSRDKTHKKILGTKFGPKWTKIWPEISFFIFLKLAH